MRELAEQTGELVSGRGAVVRETATGYQGSAFGVHSRAAGTPCVEHADVGTATRFFPQFAADDPEEIEALFRYEPKPTRVEKDAGCEEIESSPKDNVYGEGVNSATKVRTDEQAEDGVDRGLAHNTHATVKSVALMRWLIRLISKPGDVILDPFGGSGTTGVAALAEGRRVILVEREAQYVEIIRARLQHAAPTREHSARLATRPIRVDAAPDFGPLFSSRAK